MTLRSAIMNLLQQENLNFLLTNRLPRRALSRFGGWFSRIEQPLVRDASLLIWRFLADVDLSDARHTNFRSMHDCFTRSLKDGARPIDTNSDIVVSPCDAIIGASGTVECGQALQIKGHRYKVEDLLGDAGHAAEFRDGLYATLRLTSGMYHHFHAPHDCRVESVAHFPGDAWNVNPVALNRVENLYCKNERAVIRTRLVATGHMLTLVPVAAILVAGIRLRFLDLALRHRKATRRTFPCGASLGKGEEMGWFEHGSTIILFAPAGFRLSERVRDGAMIRAGEPLFRLPA